MQWIGEHASAGPCPTTSPEYITAMRSQSASATVMSWAMKTIAERGIRRRRRGRDRGIWRSTMLSRLVVGSSGGDEVRLQRHDYSDQRLLLLHAARQFIRAEAQNALELRDADLGEPPNRLPNLSASFLSRTKACGSQEQHRDP
jgi:hypothetical protein